MTVTVGGEHAQVRPPPGEHSLHQCKDAPPPGQLVRGVLGVSGLGTTGRGIEVDWVVLGVDQEEGGVDVLPVAREHAALVEHLGPGDVIRPPGGLHAGLVSLLAPEHGLLLEAVDVAPLALVSLSPHPPGHKVRRVKDAAHISAGIDRSESLTKIYIILLLTDMTDRCSLT